MPRNIFITGGTGYMGSRLIPLLQQRGHRVAALVRPGSESKLPPNTLAVSGNALEANSYTAQVQGSDTFIHLIGVPHPSPSKAEQFQQVDLASVQVASQAACAAGVQHFIYLSVAHPAPMMKAYVAVRVQCENILRGTPLRLTCIRPWYVMGPGHRWPMMLVPLYRIAERLPPTRDGARRLGLVSLADMLATLLWAVENPPEKEQVLDVPRILELGLRARGG